MGIRTFPIFAINKFHAILLLFPSPIRMKNFLIATTSFVLFAVPSFALASFDTPEDLLQAMQEHSVRSVRSEIHAHTKGTYVSVWANSMSKNIEGENSVLSKATVDVSAGVATLRARGEMMMKDNTVYLRINSLKGALENLLADFTANGYKEQWLRFPWMNGVASPLNAITMDLNGINPEQASMMFIMHRTQEKGQSIYTLTLTDDAKMMLAQKIMTLLSESNVPTTDIFPWRNLVRSLEYTLVIRTDAKDHFLASSLRIAFVGQDSGLSITTTESTTKDFTLTLPKHTIQFEDVFSLISSSLTESNIPPKAEATTEATTENVASVETTSTNALCSDSSQTPSALMSLQRGGVCPVLKTTTRARGW